MPKSSKKCLQNEVNIVKNGRRRGLWRGLGSNTKNVRNLDPLKPSKVGWRVGGSIVFTCSPDLKKGSKIRSTSTQNGGVGSQKALPGPLQTNVEIVIDLLLLLGLKSEVKMRSKSINLCAKSFSRQLGGPGGARGPLLIDLLMILVVFWVSSAL